MNHRREDANELSRAATAPLQKLRLTFTDRLGIVADIALLLSEHGVNIIAMEVEVDPVIQGVQVYLALDATQSQFPRENIRSMLAVIPGLQRIEPVRSLPRERREAWLRLVLDSISDGLLAVDEKGCLTLINRAAQNLFGMDPAALVGRRVDTLELGDTRLLDALEGRPCLRAPRHHVVGKHRAQFIATTLSIRDGDSHIMGAVEILQNMTQLRSLAQAIIQPEQAAFANIIGSSPALRPTIRLAQQVASTDVVICLRGESGTGKELFTRAIHNESGRTGEFVAINCAALPPDLLESELFGYTGGAFTGAQREGKPGLFELAKDGTLFLDEIGELPPGPQAKLLRVIQESAIRRVGGTREIPMNARIITATSRNLEKMMVEGEFRHDLFYRINVFPIYLPALHERREDIPQLVEHFLFRFNARLKRPAQSLNGAALEKLIQYHWPGNIRELRNVVERAAILSEGRPIGSDSILFNFELGRDTGQIPLTDSAGEPLPRQLARYERKLLMAALGEHRSIRKTALSLGISHTTLLNKLKKHGIELATL